jgi:hypothetical protein
MDGGSGGGSGSGAGSACGAGGGAYSGVSGGVDSAGSGGGESFGFGFRLGVRDFDRWRILVPIFAVAEGASGTDFRGRRGGLARGRVRGCGRGRGTLFSVRTTRTGFAFGSPTSAPSGGGSGARSIPGSRRTASSATKTIATTRATPRHLILTPLIPSQGTGRRELSPSGPAQPCSARTFSMSANWSSTQSPGLRPKTMFFRPLDHSAFCSGSIVRAR